MRGMRTKLLRAIAAEESRRERDQKREERRRRRQHRRRERVGAVSGAPPDGWAQQPTGGSVGWATDWEGTAMADKDKDKDRRKEVTTPNPDHNGAVPAVDDPQIQSMPEKK